MKYTSIDDIYSANRKLGEALKNVLREITPDEATALPGDEKWSIQQIAEHVSMVGSGVVRICSRLLGAARTGGKESGGGSPAPEEFAQRVADIADKKLEAPEIVHPTGDVSIAETIDRLEKIDEALEALRPDLERYDSSEHKFPHPYFGDMTAAEWLIVKGGHEARHTKQIQRLAERLRQ